MKNPKDHPRLILFIFTLGILAVIGTTLFLQTQQTPRIQSEANSNLLAPYCRDGVYKVKSQIDGSEINCGRAPGCGGYSYDAANGIDWQNAGTCWYHARLGVSKCDTTCRGHVPLCCYEIEATGDPSACNWPERGYCHANQCASITNDDCGGGPCRCGSAIATHCRQDGCITDASQIPYIPLAQRISGQSAPAPTNTPVPPPPTNTPAPQQPTNTPPPNNPTAPPQQPTQPIQPPNTGATWTPVPTWTPAPTWTQTPFNPLNIFNPPPTQVVQQPGSNIQPPANNVPTTVSNNNVNPPQNNEPLPTSAPIEIKSPKELAREVINLESVSKLSESTDKALSAPKKGFSTIKSYDQKLETTVQSWWEKAWMYVKGLIQ